jgi:hypothetical protein
MKGSFWFSEKPLNEELNGAYIRDFDELFFNNC